MIEATCGACGTVARIAESDVPVGAKFVTCASCKSRVSLPAPSAAPGKLPPKLPPAIPKTPPPKIPAPTKPTLDLADLPAPKKPSAPAGSLKPAPSGGADLPAPKTTRPTAPSALDLDDLMGADLPAPKGKTDAGLADLPAPKPRTSALANAPASKPASTSALADLPAPKAKPSALADLPAPKGKPAGLDLGDLPAPKAKAGLDLGDLPAPKSKAGAASLDLDDLPAPKGGLDLGGLDLGDLPAPKGKAAASLDLDDLPAPKGGGLSLDSDLDLPMPKAGASDLPAPKGFFDDLPQPAKKAGGDFDLPAPKGFFDDLPQPVTNTKTADLPAPKGFFDDLPQPATASGGSGGGFFDDLPQPSKPTPASAKPSKAAGPDDISFGSDLDLALSGDAPLELDIPGGGGGGFAAVDAGGAPELDLGLPLGQDPDFTELDLSEPSGKGSVKPAAVVAAPPPDDGPSPIKIKTPKGGKPATPIPITVKKDENKDLSLDLADDPHEGKGAPAAAAGAGGKAVAKKKGPSAEQTAEEKARKRKRTRVMLAGVLGVALLGAGGFYGYQKHAAKQERAEKIGAGLDTARKALGDANPNHWQRAARAADAVLELEPNNVPALGLAAEAAIAGALDNGQNYDKRIAHGRTLTQRGLGAGKKSRELERARALMSIAAGQADRALPPLQQLIASEPKNGWLQLYMGWAQLVKGDAAAAEKAFEQAVALDAATKLPALYGHGQAKLMTADLQAARSDFSTVLEQQADHIGAQVGLAATLPPQQAAQREADLVAILARPDLDKADPRAIVKAWTLSADVARTTGRLDIARERYRKALAIQQLDLGALTGLAAVELRDGKVQVARDLLSKALAANANDAEAQLLDAYADILEGRLPDAEGKIAKLFERQPPLPTLQLARLHIAKGRLLEAQGKDEDAISTFTEGAKLAGDLDLNPTMAAVTKLSELAKKAPDEAAAAAYRARADQLLSALAEKAREDGEVALTLGIAYLEAGDAHKAEDMLRRAVAMRDKDPESRLQLGKALSQLGRIDDAIAQLKDALALDPKRGDVSLQLARTYQSAGRDTEAVAAYEQLLAEKDVPVIVRVLAGRYFASKGAFDKAAAQAQPILDAEPDNAGGLYLKGEGLILAKKWDEARVVLTRAADADQTDAQALDALGRAFDGSLAATNDTKFIEGARHAYDRASKADPKMFHPRLGLGHALILQGQTGGGKTHFDEAIKALSAASALDKSHSGVSYNMGLAYYGLRALSPVYKKGAADWFESALKTQPELSLPERADASYKLGDLYFDMNKPPQSAAAFENATKLGEQMEKDLGKGPDWLTETFFRIGQVYEGMNNKPLQKRAWQKYIDRNPPASTRKKDVEYWLGTTGKSF